MDQNEILERARAVGKLLAGPPRVKAFRDSQQRLEKDEQARRLLRDYQTLADKLQRQQAQGQRPSEQDIQQLNKHQDSLAGNDAVKTWLRSQTDFVELMFSVDRAIQEGLAEASGAPPGQAGGGGAKPAESGAGPGRQGGPQAGKAPPFIPTIVPPGGAEA